MDDLQREFNAGVDAYWSGECPDGWSDRNLRDVSPFLAGWYMASLWETSPGTLVDEHGDALNPDE